MFKDAAGTVIYVGKAKSLRVRLRSYFQPPVKLGPKTSALVSRVSSVSHIEVSSELEALLLESRLIKKFLPQYNIAARDDKSPYFIHITSETYPRPVINHLARGAIAGPFLNRQVPVKILRWLRHTSPFCTSPRPVKRPCFYSHMGLCSPCPAMGEREPYLVNISRLRRMLSGRFSAVKSELTILMRKAAKNVDFETAAKTRDYVRNLDQLLARPAIAPEEYIVNPNLVSDLRTAALESLQRALETSLLRRIEFFDNAHIVGDSATAAMTVAIGGEIIPRFFRHFTLKSSTDDLELMAEVLGRRLKRTDWPKPDLIVLDGGKPQLSVVKWTIPTIALAKREEIIYTRTGGRIELPRDHPGLMLLMRLRDEAHRFARRLHHKHRSATIKS